MNQQQEFLKDLDIKQDSILDAPLTDETTEEVVETEKEQEVEAKNRRERRLLEKNQQLREEAIAATARAQALSEVNKFTNETGDDHLKKLEAIFGTDTPEKLAATNILKEALSGMSERAKQEALAEIDKRQDTESQAVLQEEQNLDEISDRMEYEYGINMESEGKNFFSLLEKLSPKDREGNIIEYADADSVAEIYLSQQKKDNSRAKDLSNRSMVRGGSVDTKVQTSAMEQYLKENGII